MAVTRRTDVVPHRYILFPWVPWVDGRIKKCPLAKVVQTVELMKHIHAEELARPVIKLNRLLADPVSLVLRYLDPPLCRAG